MDFKTFFKKSRMKRWDFIILISLVILSFIPILIFSIYQSKINEVTYQAIVKVDGKQVKVFDLSENGQHYTYRYEDKDGDYNIIEVNRNQIRMKEANCGDQICVKRGWIKKPGETIVCLPHKLVIEIQSSDGSESGSVIY